MLRRTAEVWRRNSSSIHSTRSIHSSTRSVASKVVMPGVVSRSPRTVPAHIDTPPYVRGFPVPPERVGLKKDTADIEGLRSACTLAKQVLDYAATLLRPGITTEELDVLVHEKIIQEGAYPSPLNYRGFPKSVCTSVNNVVCHGIPDNRALEDGDIINVDVTVYKDGFHGDTSATYGVGASVDAAGKRLMQVTRECLDKAVRACGPHKRLSVIGQTIQAHAESAGFSVCMEFTGHGIGRDFHEAPTIYHFANYQRGTMLPGMAFTIEPILNEGRREMRVLEDGWTAVTVDGRRSAQFEHTILITQTGVEVLTA
eukprot:m.118902 g.118902  ORF g.118902 m.118902 type:complete len:313 (+) comp16138_c0_seq1:97-1035(+)